MNQPMDVKPPDLPPAKPAPAKGRFRFSKVLGRWWWLAAIVIIAVTYTVSMIPKWMHMRGPLYESTALIQVMPMTDTGGCGFGDAREPQTLTRQFIQTQFEIITAPMTLEIALKKYDLLNRLGGDKTEALKRMQKSIRTSRRRGTDLIEISYRDEDAELARDGVTAVYEAYKDRRDEALLNMRKEQLRAIKTELQKKNDRVDELRKRLMDIAAKAGTTYLEKEEAQQFPGADLKEKKLYEASRERDQLTIRIKRISVADTESLLASANDLKQENDYINRLLEQYLLRESELDALKSAGLGKEHPKIKQHTESLTKAKVALQKAVLKEQETLRQKAAILDRRIKKMKETVNNLQDSGTDRARTMQEFIVARKEYEKAEDLRDQMEIKSNVEKAKLALPTNSIILHQTPEKGIMHVTRGREFFTTLGTVLSLPFSIGFSIMLMYIAELIFPRRQTT